MLDLCNAPEKRGGVLLYTVDNNGLKDTPENGEGSLYGYLMYSVYNN